MRGQSGLKGLLVAVGLVFALAIFMLIAVNVVEPLYDLFSGGAVADQGYGGQLSFARDTVLLFAPTMIGIGILLYAYASIQRAESFFGSGGPPR